VARINDGTIWTPVGTGGGGGGGAPTGPAGGDLSGTYPNPTLLPASVASLNLFTTSLKGLAPPSGGGTTAYLRADGTWAVPGAAPSAPTGPAGGSLAGTYPDPTIAPGVITATELATFAVTTVKIFNANVTNLKLATGANNTVKGTNAAGAIADLTGTQLTATLDLFTTLRGLVPGSSGGTVNYLRADGTWATPPNSTYTAATVPFTPAAGIAATDVQAALVEVAGDVTALPTLTTSDTAKVPIATASGVTTLDVGNLVSATSLVSSDTSKLVISTTAGVTTLNVSNLISTPFFLDNTFAIQDNGDPTRQLRFEVSAVPTATTRTFAVPVTTANDTFVMAAATQLLTNKSLTGPIIQAGTAGITIRNDADTAVNDWSRTNAIELFGNTSMNGRFAYLHQGGNATTYAQTASGNTMGQITARGYNGSTFSTGNHTAITFAADEACTGANNRGARISFLTMPLATAGNPLEALRCTSSANVDVAIRSGLVVGAGATMAAPTAGYGLECKAGGIGYGVGAGAAVTQITNRTTAVTINALSGAITLFNAAGSATWTGFTVLNNLVQANDVIKITQKSGTNQYLATVTQVTNANSFVLYFSAVVGTASDSPVFQFNIYRGAVS
jgi:hypothetical protein